MMERGNLYRISEKSFEKIIVHIVQPSRFDFRSGLRVLFGKRFMIFLMMA